MVVVVVVPVFPPVVVVVLFLVGVVDHQQQSPWQSLFALQQSWLTFKLMPRFLRVNIGILFELELEDYHLHTD